MVRWYFLCAILLFYTLLRCWIFLIHYLNEPLSHVPTSTKLKIFWFQKYLQEMQVLGKLIILNTIKKKNMKITYLSDIIWLSLIRLLHTVALSYATKKSAMAKNGYRSLECLLDFTTLMLLNPRDELPENTFGLPNYNFVRIWGWDIHKFHI